MHKVTCPNCKHCHGEFDSNIPHIWYKDEYIEHYVDGVYKETKNSFYICGECGIIFVDLRLKK